jgi:hypothetical protein
MTNTPTYDDLSALCAQLAAALSVSEKALEYYGDTMCARDDLAAPGEIKAALTAYRTLSPDPQWQRVPEVDEARLKEVHTAIAEYLRRHEMLHVVSSDPNRSYVLTDHLSSGPTIKEGIEEIESIAEWLTVALRDGGFISGNRARGEG